MRQQEKYLRALIVPSPAQFVPLRINRFPNKVARKVPNNIPRNHPFCSFASFLTVSQTLFFNVPDSSSGITIYYDIIHFFIRNY